MCCLKTGTLSFLQDILSINSLFSFLWYTSKNKIIKTYSSLRFFDTLIDGNSLVRGLGHVLTDAPQVFLRSEKLEMKSSYQLSPGSNKDLSSWPGSYHQLVNQQLQEIIVDELFIEEILTGVSCYLLSLLLTPVMNLETSCNSP